MTIGGTRLARFGTHKLSCQYNYIFSPSFLVSFGALCFFVLHIHLIHSSLTHSSLPSSIDAQCTIEYKSELSCCMLAPDERYQFATSCNAATRNEAAPKTLLHFRSSIATRWSHNAAHSN